MKLSFLQVGEIVTVHGIRGDVKVNPWTDGPEFLCDFSRVRIDGKEYKLEKCRVKKNCTLVKFHGIDTVEDAQLLRGKIVEIFREDVKDDTIFFDEIVGMTVICEGNEIGKVTEVLDYPGNNVYVIQGENQYMIPAVKEFILSVDLEKNEMQVKMLEGMRCDED